MKHIIFIATICMIGSCTSCTNSNANTSTGKAVFSYNLDGTKISGGEVDALMMNNAAFVTKTDNGPKISFFLNDAYKDKTETFSHSLRFAIPGKTGTITLTEGQDNFSIQLFLSTGEEGKYVLYANEGFTITVTSISATQVSGTFSGKVKLVEGTGSGKAEFAITDGKFDIPVRSTK